MIQARARLRGSLPNPGRKATIHLRRLPVHAGCRGSSGGYLVACGTPTHVAFFGTRLTRQVHRRRRAKLELSLFASQLEVDHIAFGTVSGPTQRGDLAARETIGADPTSVPGTSRPIGVRRGASITRTAVLVAMLV